MAFSEHHQWGVCIQSDGGSAIVYFLKVTRHNGAVTDTFFMADPAYNGCHTDPIVTVHRCLAMINQLWSRGARKKIRFNYQLRATLGGTCTTLGSDPVSNMTHLSRLAHDIACKKKGAAIMLYLLKPSLWEIDRVSKREVDQSAFCWGLPHQRVSKLQYLFQQNQKRSWYYENRCTQLRFVLGYKSTAIPR